MSNQRYDGVITYRELDASIKLLSNGELFDERLRAWLQHEQVYASWLHHWCVMQAADEAVALGVDPGRVQEYTACMFQRAAIVAFMMKCAYDFRSAIELKQLFEMPTADVSRDHKKESSP